MARAEAPQRLVNRRREGVIRNKLSEVNSFPLEPVTAAGDDAVTEYLFDLDAIADALNQMQPVIIPAPAAKLKRYEDQMRERGFWIDEAYLVLDEREAAELL